MDPSVSVRTAETAELDDLRVLREVSEARSQTTAPAEQSSSRRPWRCTKMGAPATDVRVAQS
jgi:hypothetical protein